MSNTFNIEVWRHDYTSDSGMEAVEIIVNDQVRTLLFHDFDEATALVDALVELFNLQRSCDIWYQFSSKGKDL